MEYQKLINLFDNTPNQPTTFRGNIWFWINYEERRTYNTIFQIKFKTSKLRLSLYDHSDAYILVKRTITIAPVPPPEVEPNNNNKEVAFKSFAPFTDRISEINNAHTK